MTTEDSPEPANSPGPSPSQQHAIQRAWERYGLEIDATTLKHIADTCRAGKAGLVAHGEDASLYHVTIGDTVCLVAYKRASHRILTFLPRTPLYAPRTPQAIKEARRYDEGRVMQSKTWRYRRPKKTGG